MKSAIKERISNKPQYIRESWNRWNVFFKLGDEAFKLKEGIGTVQLAAVVNEGGEVRPGGWFDGLLLNLNPNKH